MRRIALAIVCLALSASAASAQYLGNYTRNPYLPPAPPQPPGTYSNPYGTSSDSPKLYDNQGQYRGNLNSNQYDPNSVANSYDRYGSQYSPDSITNPYGAGSPYRQDSPNNPYGTGMQIYK